MTDETELRKTAGAKQAGRKRFSGKFLLIVCVLAIAGGFAAYQFLPASSKRSPIKIRFEKGDSLDKIAGILERKGIVRNSFALEAYVLYRQSRSGLHLEPVGNRTLSPDMSLWQVVQELRRGDRAAEQVKIVIPEGFTLKQIASRLDKSGITNGKEFLALAEHPDRIEAWNQDFPRPEDSLEGYLFPDTYRFPPKSPPEQVLEEMMSNFTRRFFRPYKVQMEANKRELGAVVTVASLIEREAKTDDDRPRIAGVIDNRLRKKMRLEIDATVLYALGRHKSRVMFKDLEIDSPYNTYRNSGLPPGPIASPGLDSLKAAVEPEKNDYLYYVARPDGAHLFTRTEAEHNRAIQQVKRERRAENAVEETPGG